jgi:hypothetical protein
MLYRRIKGVLVRLMAVAVAMLPLAASPLVNGGVARASAPTPEMVSVDGGGLPMASGASGGYISDSGRYVLFSAGQNSYVRDRTVGATMLATVLADGSPTNSTGVMSGDGRHVAFSSGSIAYIRDLDAGTTGPALVGADGNLVDGNVIGLSDDASKVLFSASDGHAYIHDRETGESYQMPDGFRISMSGDGNTVVFWHLDTCSQSQFGCYQVHAYNRQTGVNTLVSANSAGEPADGVPVGSPEVSDNGRYVVFADRGHSLLPRNISAYIYRRDMTTGVLQYADVLDSGLGAVTGWADYADSASYAISGDGSVVAFGSTNAGGFTGDTTGGHEWYAHNFTTGHTGMVNANSAGDWVTMEQNFNGSLSYDGSLTAFDSNDLGLGISDGNTQVFVNATIGTGKVDTTPPVVGTFEMQPIEIYPNDTVDNFDEPISVPVSDNITGVYDGEYFLDGNDPGLGHAARLTSFGDHLAGDIVMLNSEFAPGMHAVSVRARDASGNWSEAQTAEWVVTAPGSTLPVLGAFSWSLNPMAILGTTTLTVPVGGDIAGAASGEYFVGSDPGQGSATPMNFDGSNLSAAFGSNLAPGVYQVGVRAVDNAGNWSQTATDYLVVYDPSGLKMQGKKDQLVPVYGADVLPGLIAGGQPDAVKLAFLAEYKSGQINQTKSDFKLSYKTGIKCNKPAQAQNCHDLSVDATNIAWLVVDGANNSYGTFQGTASVTLDGMTTSNPFRVEGLDGARVNSTTPDHVVVRIFAVGADPNTAAPLYVVNEDVARGSVTIQ